MKNKNLISQVKKLQKSLEFAKGHKLLLYGTDYEVSETNDKFTFLKDPNGAPVAFSTKKLRQIITRSMKENIVKAMGPASANPGSGTAGSGKMHSGMIRVDKVDSKGNKYHYWIQGQKGTRHSEPSENSPAESHIHEADQKLHSQMTSIIHKHAAPEDTEKLSKKLQEWVEVKSEYVNLKEAHNQLARESGGVPSTTVNMIANKQAEHEKLFQELKSALAASAKKKLE